MRSPLMIRLVEPRGMITDGKAYIQYETVRDYINSRFYWDPNEKYSVVYPSDGYGIRGGGKQGLLGVQ